MTLDEKMYAAYQLALQVIYAPREDGHCVEQREPACADDDAWSWADGLYHKYAEKRKTGQCSLQATIDFDVVQFEAMVDEHITRFTGLLAQLH